MVDILGSSKVMLGWQMGVDLTLSMVDYFSSSNYLFYGDSNMTELLPLPSEKSLHFLTKTDLLDKGSEKLDIEPF